MFITTDEDAWSSDEQSAEHTPRLLLVDDDEMVRFTLFKILQSGGFNVATASSVNEALKLISSQPFDALLSDLHMPGAGDGLTVVSAMRHFNPKAVTMIFSGYPEMKKAAAAILLQADEILVKPMSPPLLIQTIKERLKLGANAVGPPKQTVAYLLEQDTQATIDDWLSRVILEPDVISVRLPVEERTAHLPQLFRDLIERLRNPLPLGTRASTSKDAAFHGLERRRQGYTAAMIVEESRMLQVSIFQTLQNNLHQVDFSLLLLGVMAIADEVDSQLAQSMASYIAEAIVDNGPIVA
jgi:CheY-like chemotaxis protein